MNMPYFDRFDICEAYYALNHDYNGHPTLLSVSTKLKRMNFKPSPNLLTNMFEALEENGQAIYIQWEMQYGNAEHCAGGN